MGGSEWSEKKASEQRDSLKWQWHLWFLSPQEKREKKNMLQGERGPGAQAWMTMPMPGNTGMCAAQILVIQDVQEAEKSGRGAKQ